MHDVQTYLNFKQIFKVVVEGTLIGKYAVPRWSLCDKVRGAVKLIDPPIRMENPLQR